MVTLVDRFDNLLSEVRSSVVVNFLIEHTQRHKNSTVIPYQLTRVGFGLWSGRKGPKPNPQVAGWGPNLSNRSTNVTMADAARVVQLAYGANI